MKKILILLPIVILSGCNLSSTEGSGGGTSSDVAEALNQEAPTIDIPGGEAASLTTQRVVTVDDGNDAIGAQGADFSWVLDVAQEMSNLFNQFSQGLFFKNDDGSDSMISTILSNVTAGSTSFGPMEVSEGGTAFTFGILFQSFSGCASDGTLHTEISSTNPLSLTFFIGGSSSDLERAVSVCVTSIDPLVAQGWMAPEPFITLFEGGGAPSGLVMHLTVDLSNTDCPFTNSERYTATFVNSGGGTGHFADIPSAFDGDLCVNSDDSASFLVTTHMTFGTATEAGPCAQMDEFLINLATDGSQVAGSISLFLNNQLITAANGGITGGNPSECPSNATLESVMASLATGLCANSSGALLTSADCSVDDSFTLLTPADNSDASTDASFPSDAPDTFAP